MNYTCSAALLFQKEESIDSSFVSLVALGASRFFRKLFYCIIRLFL